MDWYDARIRWRSPKERGTRALPPTLRYIGISRFPPTIDPAEETAWSVECVFDVPPPEQPDPLVSEGRVRFLMDRAPQHWLRSGVTFELYEGAVCVADVDVT